MLFCNFLTIILLPIIGSARLLPYDFSSTPFQAVSAPKKFTSLLTGDPFLGVTYHSGYINVGRAGGEMFYWYFPNTKNNTDLDTPVLLWLTGGPGCSSELAALTENGPLTTDVADVVFVDQPLGTGFSSVGDPRNYVTNEESVAADMVEFLEKFIDQYPTVKDKPFFITGESYAGHYIPSVTQALLRNPVDRLNLKGMAIGNGWVDPALTPPMCYNGTAIDTFMNEPAVQKALGVHHKWKECDPVVYALMMGDWITESRTKVAEIVEAGLQVLIYNGDQDFICNWRGGEAWVNSIEWSKQDDFISAEKHIWRVNDKPAGEMKNVDNLFLLRVFDAGHMVPMDMPDVALKMISEFLATASTLPSTDKLSVENKTQKMDLNFDDLYSLSFLFSSDEEDDLEMTQDVEILQDRRATFLNYARDAIVAIS